MREQTVICYSSRPDLLKKKKLRESCELQTEAKNQITLKNQQKIAYSINNFHWGSLSINEKHAN